MKKIMEQKTQQNKKSKLNVPAMVLSGLLAAGAVVGLTTAFTGCPSPTGGPGGGVEQPDDNLIASNVWPYEHFGAGGPWQNYITKEYYTEKESTDTEKGLGYQRGIEYKINVYRDGTVQRLSESRTYEPEGTVYSEELHGDILVYAKYPWLKFGDDITIGKGEVLCDDGICRKREDINNDNGVIILPTDKNPTMDLAPDGMGGNYSPSVPTLDIIQQANSYGSRVHDMAGVGAAYIAIQGTGSSEVKSILPQLSLQAKKLYDFFNAVQGGGAKFTNLREYEKAMLGNNTSTVNSFLSAMDTNGDAIIDEIFGAAGPENTARAEFDKYFDAYSAGYHLVTRDWNTEGSGNVESALRSAEATFRTLSDDTAYPAGNEAGIFNYEGGTLSLCIGSLADVKNQFKNMQSVMRGQIIAALGLDSSSAAAKDMADALIIQLGQDREELRAFKDDLTAEAERRPALNFENALTYPVGSGMQTVVAQAGTQSNVRLAHVDDGAAFSPELVKGAYGTKYTGSFTPYKKDENGLV